MNKTLLLILCDFLLLTILSMWKMDEEAPAAPAGPDPTEVSVSSMAIMEQDLLDTLQFALDEEKGERADLAQDLNQRAQELEQTQSELEKKAARIQSLQQEMSAAEQRELALKAAREKLQKAARQLEEKSVSLEEKVRESASNYSVVETQLRESETRLLASENKLTKSEIRLDASELAAKQSAVQSRLLQEELKKKLEDIANKEAALAATSEKLQATEKKVHELNLQVQVSAKETQILQESVTSLKGEVTAERNERAKLQEQTGKLAEGVSQLATNSQDLREELRSSIPINANQLFSDYKENQVTAKFKSIKYQRSRYVESIDSTSTILVSDGEKTYALLHVQSGPFGLRSNANLMRSIQLSLYRFGNEVVPSRMQFLALDPRILAIPVTEEEAILLGGETYLTALEPFKWKEAVLVNRQGNYYGEVEFKLDAETPGFVKMQTKILSAIFGEFSPSIGDLVFSKTGELLGVMVNRRYCLLVDNFLSSGSVDLGETLDAAAFQKALAEQVNLLDTFPNAVR